MANDVDVFLQHFGVKGMHWGQRKAREPYTREDLRNRISTLEKRRDKFDAEQIWRGGTIRGNSGIRRTRRDGTIKTYWAPPTEKAANNIAIGRYVAEGIAGTAAATVGVKLLLDRTNYSAKVKSGTQISAGILAVQTIIRPTIQNVRDIKVYEKHDKILTDIYDLKKQLKQLDKKEATNAG